jgi:Kelch motif protein
MAGSWQPLAHQPAFNASTMLLLTDGRVMCQDAGTANWHMLTPDAKGSYVNGAWSDVAPMHHTRLYYASAVLKDGRVFIAGGEYSDGAQSETTTGEIYDPRTDTWTEIAAPAGWTEIGDAPCTVLPDGRVLVGQINGTMTAIYDPVANTWTAAAAKDDPSSEETWVLLGDSTVVTPQCTSHPGAEKYLIASNQLVSASTLPVDLVEAASIEIGAGVALPDGRGFFAGATPHTAIYTPPANPAEAGTWTAGPDIPSDDSGKTCGSKDAPGCLLPDGNVLFVVGPVDGVSGDYLKPTYFYEFDGTNLLRVPDPPNAGNEPYTGRMMLLPTGQVLFAAGTPQLHAYTPSGSPSSGWRPTITNAPATVTAGLSHTLFGTQLNGLSQACGYGDDTGCATNYPLVRLRNPADGSVQYCRTFDHSTMAIATGSSVQSTSFSVPSGTPAGTYDLVVIANGIASASVSVFVSTLKIPFDWEAVWQWLIGSLADGPLWAIGPHGPVPVDPMGAKIIAQARNARRQMLQAARALEKIGSRTIQQRLKISQNMPRSFDLDAGEGPGESKSRKTVPQKKRTPKTRKRKNARKM